MVEQSTDERFGSREMWPSLEAMARERIQRFVQELLKEEVTALVGRAKSERRPVVGEGAPVYRNGHGKPRRLSMSGGTIKVRRPRVRGLEERFESRVLPLFARRRPPGRRRHAAAGLGADSDLLRLPAGTLEAPSYLESSRVALCGGPSPDRRRQALPEGLQRHGVDLAVADGRRTILPTARPSRAPAGGRHGCPMRRRSPSPRS